jgi:hypothetical protein
MQRLFSTFPAGSPGFGLLLLRAAVGTTAIMQGFLYIVGLSLPTVENLSAGLQRDSWTGRDGHGGLMGIGSQHE